MTQSTTPPQHSTFSVSVPVGAQAHMQADIETLICLAANNFLLIESKEGRIAPESVAKVKRRWEGQNRPQVIEFLYDQLTQHELIVANLKTVNLHGECANNPLMLSSLLHGWKTLARETAVRTFCLPDAVVRKHLNDAPRVLELLDAPLSSILTMEQLQLEILARINRKQKQRLAREEGRKISGHSRNLSDTSQVVTPHRRVTSDGSVTAGMGGVKISPAPTSSHRHKIRKATGAEGAIAEAESTRARHPYANFSGGQMGLTL